MANPSDYQQQTADEISQKVNWMANCYRTESARFDLARRVGNELAKAVAAYYADRDETKLRAAYETWMGHDAGNFALPMASS